jgi:ATP-dependent DNA helicase RecG
MQPLTQKQITTILKRGEGETVEFKKVFDRETVETLCAFANTRDGQVFIGVSDTGGVLGLQVGKETIQNWINQVKLSTANALIPDVYLLSIKKKTIAVLSVAEYPIKPVGCRGRYFKRINANHLMSVSEVVNTHLKTFNTSWDSYVDELHTEADLSLDKVQAFIERINRNREIPLLDDPLSLLQKFELLRDGRLTHAAFLLFMAGESSMNTI